MSANVQVGVHGYAHSSPYSLLWLSFAAFRIFCLLEVKSHVFLLTAHCEDIHWQGYPGWCRIALARPWFSWSHFCPGRRQGGHKDANGNLEGRLDFVGSQLLCAVLTKCIFSGQSNCIVLYCMWAEKALQILCTVFVSLWGFLVILHWFSLLSLTTTGKSLIPSRYSQS